MRPEREEDDKAQATQDSWRQEGPAAFQRFRAEDFSHLFVCRRPILTRQGNYILLH